MISFYNLLPFAHNVIPRLQLLFGKYQADEQAWVDTIKSVGVGATVRINTMDWLGQSQYTTQTVYWSSLSSAISEVSWKLLISSNYLFCLSFKLALLLATFYDHYACSLGLFQVGFITVSIPRELMVLSSLNFAKVLIYLIVFGFWCN